jgi:hypothetical protein
MRNQSWQEFNESGLLCWINTILHMFGWSIFISAHGDKIIDVWPVRVLESGVKEEENTEQSIKTYECLKDIIKTPSKEEIEKLKNEMAERFNETLTGGESAVNNIVNLKIAENKAEQMIVIESKVMLNFIQIDGYEKELSKRFGQKVVILNPMFDSGSIKIIPPIR